MIITLMYFECDQFRKIGRQDWTVRRWLGLVLSQIQKFPDSRRERQNHDRDAERCVVFAAAEKHIDRQDAEAEPKPASDELAFAQVDDRLKPCLQCQQAKDQNQRCEADH
jgi:hypothetical protein